MSWHFKYSPLFRIAFREDGNPGNWIEGIKIQPTSSCRQLLHQHHLIARERAYGIEVYFESNLNYPPAQQIVYQIEEAVFSFVIPERKIPNHFKVTNGLQLRNFMLDNLNNGGGILPHNSKITKEGNLSGADKIELSPGDEFYQQRPFGIVNITWMGAQASRMDGQDEHFTDYWIDIAK
jgi:hypothetical protein